MVVLALVEDSIAVNALGSRFHDEAGPYDYRVKELNNQPGRSAHYIYDNQTYMKKCNSLMRCQKLHRPLTH